MPDQLDDAIFDVARASGDDLILLSPPDERHFDPFSATAAFAVLLIVRYCKGLASSLGGGAEQAGEKTGSAIRRSLSALFAGKPDLDESDAEKATAEARASVHASGPASVDLARAAARMLLVDALVENGLPAERALLVAANVSTATEALLGMAAGQP
ncbi:hypothetical protein [Subtercola sp. YIM 133946]|uniref:hypothetical protein n=1 Tax=Subtercola sp. YIM 133946 TaxID=3118909 RepID=UPI002F95C4E0